MPTMQTNCPNCRQPVVADVEQLFDLSSDPSAKQRLLSGVSNQLSCPHCGYQGAVPTLVVYHDPEKELLLTFAPPELGLPHDEQERRIGSLINRVVNNLPQEKRKAYLLQPQTMLTFQGLIEHILEADGITKEMIEGQQNRINLIQRMMQITTDDVLEEVAQQEDELIDLEFFGLLRNLIQSAEVSANQEAAKQLTDLYDKLMSVTTVGKELKAQTQEIEAVVNDLREAGDQLTREKLLDIVLKEPTEARLRALVSLTRPGMDYQFFQQLSERVDRARGEGRARLISIREQLLNLCDEYDKEIAARADNARDLIDQISSADDIEKAMLEALPVIDEIFLHELNQALEAAEKSADTSTREKLEKMVSVLEQLSEKPPEIHLIEELLAVPEGDDQETKWREIMDSQRDSVTPEFLTTLANISVRADSEEQQAVADRLKKLNRTALRYSMEKNLA